MIDRLKRSLRAWFEASKDLTTGFIAFIFFLGLGAVSLAIFAFGVFVWLFMVLVTFPAALIELGRKQRSK